MALYSTSSDVASDMDTAAFEQLRPRYSRTMVVAPERRWRTAVESRLDDLLKLKHGWDGYRAKPVAFETASFAVRVLEAICGSSALPPQIVPGVNGDLQIEWHTNAGSIELHVKSPNRVHAWRELNDAEESLDLTVDFTAVVEWVKSLSEPVIAARAAAH